MVMIPSSTDVYLEACIGRSYCIPSCLFLSLVDYIGDEAFMKGGEGGGSEILYLKERHSCAGRTR